MNPVAFGAARRARTRSEPGLWAAEAQGGKVADFLGAAELKRLS